MLRAVLAAAIFWPAASTARGCRAVDLSAEVGPVRDQADTGWCYAHTAADLVTQHLKIRVSAVDLATSYVLGDLDITDADENLKNEIKRWRMYESDAYLVSRIFSNRGLYNVGGEERGAILMANARGFCVDQALPGGEREFRQHMGMALKIWNDPVWRERCLTESRREIRHIGSIPSPASQDMARVFQCYVDWNCGARFKPTAPVVTRHLNLAEDVEEFEEKVAKGKIDVRAAQNRLFDKIDDLLDQGKIVAIGWDASDVYADDARGTDHAATVVARREVNGVCEYRLRDNFGAACYEMQRGFRDRCDSNTGGIWFRKGEIPSLYGLTWVH